jgi:SPP1 family predicted phage head-tail adaptor
MTGIGRLRERVVLEAPVESDDGAGGVVRTYATQATLWAEIIAVGAKADVIADAVGAGVTHRITIRSGVAITMRHRFRLNARIFDVVSMRDADPQARFMLIEARERVD